MNRTHKAFLVAAAIVGVALPTHAATLVAHYSFDDPGNLGNDSSGLGNHATTVTNVTSVAGQFGGAAFFDEGQASVFREDGGLNGMSGLAGRSFAAWVKIDPAKSQFDGLFSQDGGACCTTRFLLHPDNRPFINLNAHIDRHMTGVTPLTVDTWTHVALVGESDGAGGSMATVYLDGVAVGTEVFAGTPMIDASTLNLYLGVGEGGSSHRLTGALDDVRVYDGALTAGEVQGLLVPEPSSLLLCLVAPLIFFRRRR